MVEPQCFVALVACLSMGFVLALSFLPIIGGVALIPDPNWVLFSIGTVMALLSGPIGLIMSRAGFGAERAPGHGRTSQGVDEHRSTLDD